MIDPGPYLQLAMTLLLGGAGARLLVDHPGPIADRLGVGPRRLGPLVVGLHLAVNLALVALVLVSVLAGGLRAPPLVRSVLGPLQSLTLFLLYVTPVLSLAGIALDRSLPRDADRWRPGWTYYLMAIPLLLNAILYGLDYFYQRRRHGNNAD